jgi:hypothetical protein
MPDSWRLLPQNTQVTPREASKSFLMFTKQQSSRLERIHEGNTFGDSDLRYQPGNAPAYRLLM